MALVIVGPGALGTMLAVRLSGPARDAGLELVLVDHDRQRAAHLAETGLTLEIEGEAREERVRVTAEPEAIGPAGTVLFCVKSTDLATAIRWCRPLLASHTLVVGFQNGMTHPELLSQAPGLPVAAVTSEGATLVAPGRVCHGGAGLTRLGFLDPDRTDPDRLEQLAALLRTGGLRTETSRHIHPFLWQKLVINAAINPLTAIHARKNGQLLTSCAVRATMKKIVTEARLVAGARGVELEPDLVEQVFTVCRRTRNNVSSMLQDIRRGRPTEINAINGFLVREGERLGIPTPVNREMVRAVEELAGRP